MRKLEQLKEQALQLLKEEGALPINWHRCAQPWSVSLK